MPNGLDQKINSPQHTIIKTLNIQNKERILKDEREEGQVIYKAYILEEYLTFQWRL